VNECVVEVKGGRVWGSLRSGKVVFPVNHSQSNLLWLLQGTWVYLSDSTGMEGKWRQLKTTPPAQKGRWCVSSD